MSHPLTAHNPRIAIIGAGMAGVSCAQALQQRGLPATLFEKSRGPGGRLATRRHEAGVTFDHGAQYITAHSAPFSAQLDALQRAGAAAEWQPRESGAAASHRHPWIVGTPGMNALLKPLASTLDLQTGVTVAGVQRAPQGWHLRCDTPTPTGFFDVVISTAPAPQARALLASEPALHGALDAVTIAPCWALMLRLSAPLQVSFDARRFETGAIAWIARQASRPQRDGTGEAWVVHASPDWSTRHLEQTAEAVMPALLRELTAALDVGALPEPELVKAHRWRYALTTRALGQPFLASADGSLYAGGDWCLGARVECAYQSGVGIAQAVADRWQR